MEKQWLQKVSPDHTVKDEDKKQTGSVGMLGRLNSCLEPGSLHVYTIGIKYH